MIVFGIQLSWLSLLLLYQIGFKKPMNKLDLVLLTLTYKDRIHNLLPEKLRNQDESQIQNVQHGKLNTY